MKKFLIHELNLFQQLKDLMDRLKDSVQLLTYKIRIIQKQNLFLQALMINMLRILKRKVAILMTLG